MFLSLSSSANMVVQFITVLFVFLFVLAVTYITTRWIAGYHKGRAFNRNIEVLDACKIAPNKSIQIVKAGEKYLVIGIGKDTVTMLTELTKEEIPTADHREQYPLNFKEMLERAKNMKMKKK